MGLRGCLARLEMFIENAEATFFLNYLLFKTICPLMITFGVDLFMILIFSRSFVVANLNLSTVLLSEIVFITSLLCNSHPHKVSLRLRITLS